MKKTFRNFRTLAALLIASAAFTACSNENSDIIGEQPAQQAPQVYTLTISASKGGDATRALDLSGTSLVASWDDGDVLTVVNQTKSYTALGGTLTASNASGNTATFSGALTGTIEAGDVLRLNYHAHDYFTEFPNQDGTLKGTNGAEKYDVANATVTVASVDEGNITTTGDASFTTWTAMLKLTLQDGSSNLLNPTSLTISVDGIADFLTFSPTAATYTANGNGVLYFALPNAENVAYIKMGATPSDIDTKKAALAAATVTFTAVAGGKTYVATKTGYPFTEGTYYASTLTMAEPVPALNITSPAVGQVIGDDGKNYDYASLPGGVTAVAKICYVSGSNGLALALSDEGKIDWSTAITTCAAHTPAFTGGTWKLATEDEWNNMISAAGSYTALRDGFSSVGGTNMKSGYYWSSTEKDGDNAWLFVSVYGGWDSDYKDYDYLVRACLAF